MPEGKFCSSHSGSGWRHSDEKRMTGRRMSWSWLEKKGCRVGRRDDDSNGRKDIGNGQNTKGQIIWKGQEQTVRKLKFKKSRTCENTRGNRIRSLKSEMGYWQQGWQKDGDVEQWVKTDEWFCQPNTPDDSKCKESGKDEPRKEDAALDKTKPKQVCWKQTKKRVNGEDEHKSRTNEQKTGVSWNFGPLSTQRKRPKDWQQ